MKMSGTSRASPNVVSLAVKLMTINPELSVIETIELIIAGCGRSSDGHCSILAWNIRNRTYFLAIRTKNINYSLFLTSIFWHII